MDQDIFSKITKQIDALIFSDISGYRINLDYHHVSQTIISRLRRNENENIYAELRFKTIVSLYYISIDYMGYVQGD